MFAFKADIQLTNEFRKIPIQGNTYRPLLFFGNNVVRSGLFILDEGEMLQMDNAYKNRLLKLYFYKDLDVNKEFFVGKEFFIAESGRALIGKGVITAIIGEEK